MPCVAVDARPLSLQCLLFPRQLDQLSQLSGDALAEGLDIRQRIEVAE